MTHTPNARPGLHRVWIGIRLALAGWALLVCTALPAVARGGLAVEGTDHARLLPPAGAQVDAYGNVGYELRWVAGNELEVRVNTDPLESTSRFELPALGDGEVDPVTRLARAVVGDASTHYEASSRLLGWVARNIRYELNREASQEADAVLERRSGYCTGIARLTVALLLAVDMEAREVAGYMVGEGGGFHRWIETHLPDRGWVFSDPLRSHHYVPANYVRLGSEELWPEKGTEGLLIERHDGVEAVDLFPSAAPGIRARRNSDRQLAASLRVRITDSSTGIAELTGSSERRVHSLVDGRTTFLGLDPGRYQLRVLLPGGRTRGSRRRTDRPCERDPLLSPAGATEPARYFSCTLRDSKSRGPKGPSRCGSNRRDTTASE